jgi:hypothetical protein
MVKTVPPRFRWALCLMALSASLASAQGTGNRVFIQGSEVNLRALPDPKGEVVRKVPIGTECLRLGFSKEWVRLECGGATGYMLKSLIGADKPSFDALLAQARDPKAKAPARFEAATRAAALDPKHEQALELLADLFFDVAFEQLEKDTAKTGLRETVRIRRKKLGSLDADRTVEESFFLELERIGFDWHHLRFRRGRFVSAMHRDGSLHVYGGYLSPNAGKTRAGTLEPEFNVTIQSRTSSAASEALKAALQKGARFPDTTLTLSPKEDFSTMPALNVEAHRVYRSLPRRWHALRGNKGERYVYAPCSMLVGLELLVDIHRRASLEAGYLEVVSGTASWRVTGISKVDASSYKLQLRKADEERQVTVSWPTDEANVSSWKSEPADRYLDGLYAVAETKGFPIKDIGCE